MPSGTPRRLAGRARLAVTVSTPDGGVVSTRGLGAWLVKAAPATARGEVTLALVSDGRMRALNRAFRGKNHATDVLSFPADGGRVGARHASPLHPPNRRYLGDIVIATGVARRQAREAGHSLSTELRVLALHGLLHLLGYDHETDGGVMASTEERLRRKAGLNAGLIGRSSRKGRNGTRARLPSTSLGTGQPGRSQ